MGHRMEFVGQDRDGPRHALLALRRDASAHNCEKSKLASAFLAPSLSAAGRMNTAVRPDMRSTTRTSLPDVMRCMDADLSPCSC